MSHSLNVLEVCVPAATTPAPRSGTRDGSAVPCVYCRAAIPASTFAFWTNARRLLSATCPECNRRVTLATPTWRRWIKQSLA
jgi:hypothetical protein